MITHGDTRFPGWRKIRPNLEDFWRCRARDERTRKARALYAAFLRLLLPSEWFYFPSLEQAIRLPWCAEILARDFKVRVVESDFQTPFMNFPSAVEAWVRGKRDQYIVMLPEEYHDALPPAASMDPTSLISSAADTVDDVRQGRALSGLQRFIGPLELAMAVFTVPNSPTILVARDACHAWKEDLPLEFSASGSETVVHLLELAGLDPKTTTAAEFDRADLQFMCLHCYCAHEAPWMELETWRSAVSVFRSSVSAAINLIWNPFFVRPVSFVSSRFDTN